MPPRDGCLPANHGYPMLALHALTPLPHKLLLLQIWLQKVVPLLWAPYTSCASWPPPLTPLLDKNFSKAGTAFSPFCILWTQKLRKLRQLES